MSIFGPSRKEKESVAQRLEALNAYQEQIRWLENVWPERRAVIVRGLAGFMEAAPVGEPHFGDFRTIAMKMLKYGPGRLDLIMKISYDVVNDGDGSVREYFYRDSDQYEEYDGISHKAIHVIYRDDRVSEIHLCLGQGSEEYRYIISHGSDGTQMEVKVVHMHCDFGGADANFVKVDEKRMRMALKLLSETAQRSGGRAYRAPIERAFTSE